MIILSSRGGTITLVDSSGFLRDQKIGNGNRGFVVVFIRNGKLHILDPPHRLYMQDGDCIIKILKNGTMAVVPDRVCRFGYPLVAEYADARKCVFMYQCGNNYIISEVIFTGDAWTLKQMDLSYVYCCFDGERYWSDRYGDVGREFICSDQEYTFTAQLRPYDYCMWKCRRGLFLCTKLHGIAVFDDEFPIYDPATDYIGPLDIVCGRTKCIIWSYDFPPKFEFISAWFVSDNVIIIKLRLHYVGGNELIHTCINIVDGTEYEITW